MSTTRRYSMYRGLKHFTVYRCLLVKEASFKVEVCERLFSSIPFWIIYYGNSIWHLCKYFDNNSIFREKCYWKLFIYMGLTISLQNLFKYYWGSSLYDSLNLFDLMCTPDANNKKRARFPVNDLVIPWPRFRPEDEINRYDDMRPLLYYTWQPHLDGLF